MCALLCACAACACARASGVNDGSQISIEPQQGVNPRHALSLPYWLRCAKPDMDEDRLVFLDDSNLESQFGDEDVPEATEFDTKLSFDLPDRESDDHWLALQPKVRLTPPVSEESERASSDESDVELRNLQWSLFAGGASAAHADDGAGDGASRAIIPISAPALALIVGASGLAIWRRRRRLAAIRAQRFAQQCLAP